MIWVVVILVLIVFAFIIKKKLYKIPLNNTILITGAPGTGKTTNAVDLALKIWKKQVRTAKKINKRQKYLPELWRSYVEIPLLYSNFPVRIGRLKKKEYLKRYNDLVEKNPNKKVIAFGITPFFKYFDYKMRARSNSDIIVFTRHKFCEKLEIGHLLNQIQLPVHSTTLITEIGKIADQYSWGNMNVQEHLNDFISMYRQYTQGGYFIADDQASDDIVKQIRVRIGTVINLVDYFRIWKFYMVRARRFHITEDVKTQEAAFAEDSTKLVIGIYPLFRKKYDTYAFSNRYKSVPTKENRTFYGYKTNEIMQMPKNKLPNLLTVTDD